MDPARRIHDNLEHARWRVRFVRSLLDAHQHNVDTSKAAWWIEEADLLQRLAAAEEDLALQVRDPGGQTAGRLSSIHYPAMQSDTPYHNTQNRPSRERRTPGRASGQ